MAAVAIAGWVMMHRAGQHCLRCWWCRYALAPNALVVAAVAMVEAMDVIAVPALR